MNGFDFRPLAVFAVIGMVTVVGLPVVAVVWLIWRWLHG